MRPPAPYTKLQRSLHPFTLSSTHGHLNSVQVSPVGSIDDGLQLCGIPVDAENAGTSGKAAGAAGVGVGGSGVDTTGALQSTLPGLEPRAGIRSMHAAPATHSTVTSDSETARSVEARLTRHSEVLTNADASSVRSKGIPGPRGGVLGRDGEEGRGMETVTTIGEDESSEIIRPMALLRAMFHQTTDLGTLAESDAWRTPSVPTFRTNAIAAQPAQGAPVKERLAYISSQLDAFGRRGVILDRYEMLGGDDRCQGGACLPWRDI